MLDKVIDLLEEIQEIKHELIFNPEVGKTHLMIFILSNDTLALAALEHQIKGWLSYGGDVHDE